MQITPVQLGSALGLEVTGPKTKADSRDKIVPIRFNEEELAGLDRLRGDASRSDFVRRLVRDAANP